VSIPGREEGGRLPLVPTLVDTTIRLLGQEPLAGVMPTAAQLDLAEILDSAGFAYLEVSGGGCFDSAVKRGLESPWERIRALRDRTKTPLALALRGRFLVGSRPVGPEFVRRFVASAAESGIDVFRLHDPLNDVSNLREASEAITGAGREFDAGLVYSPGPSGETDALLAQARRLVDLGAARVLIHDPSGSLEPNRVRELVEAVRDASGLPIGLYCQGAGGSALAATVEAARAGVDLIACAVYPVALVLHRTSGEAAADALASLGLGTGVNVEVLWRASDVIDEHIGDQPVAPLSPRIATRAAQHSLPAGLVAALDIHLRAHRAGDRLDEVIAELSRIRAEAGWPPLAAPIGQVLASQALLHVLAAERYQTVVDELRDLFAGRYGTPPADVSPAVRRALELVTNGVPLTDEPPDLGELRERYSGLASSEEELLLVALFGEAAEPLLRTIRNRGRDDSLGGGVDASRAERIREIVRIVQESGVGEVTIEDEGLRVTVRRTPEQAEPVVTPSPVTSAEEETTAAAPAGLPSIPDVIRVEAPMVGTFYRAPSPGAPPFVEEGDVVDHGQTLCILEAMKLMNEVKAEQEGVVRRICADNAQPVEYGQLLFELEPVNGRPPGL
jgi:oxaloacetate decarboxylase (Na+ extruding) subunit alpha